MPATISLSSPETKHFTENFFNTLVVAGHKSGFDCRTKMVAVKSSVASAMLRRERVGGGGGVLGSTCENSKSMETGFPALTTTVKTCD